MAHRVAVDAVPVTETRHIRAADGSRVPYTVHRGPDGRIIRAVIPRQPVALKCACHASPKGPCMPRP